MKAHGYPADDIAWQLIARSDTPEHLAMLSKEIDQHFRNSPYETRTMTEKDAISDGLSQVGNIRAMVYSLCAIVILTVWLIAANSAAIMVRDRIGEVAVMRALGFSPGQIANLLFGECALIGMAGGALGAGAGLVAVRGRSVIGRGAGRQWRVVRDAGGGDPGTGRSGHGEPAERRDPDNRGDAYRPGHGLPPGGVAISDVEKSPLQLERPADGLSLVGVRHVRLRTLVEAARVRLQVGNRIPPRRQEFGGKGFCSLSFRGLEK